MPSVEIELIWLEFMSEAKTFKKIHNQQQQPTQIETLVGKDLLFNQPNNEPPNKNSVEVKMN